MITLYGTIAILFLQEKASRFSLLVKNFRNASGQKIVIIVENRNIQFQ